MTPHFEWTWHTYFDAINMYGDIKIYIFRVRQTKGYLVRRQWIDVKFDVMCM